ncbi:MAG: hypothetical protein J5965_10020, partial [Aeriscardovia sp.]|nr:hypothetical protein [Aeriscardovia sp.]
MNNNVGAAKPESNAMVPAKETKTTIKPSNELAKDSAGMVLNNLRDAANRPIAIPSAIIATEIPIIEPESPESSAIVPTKDTRTIITASKESAKACPSIVLRSLSDADSKPIATPIAINATEEERSLPLSGILFRATITAIRVAIKPPKAITIEPKSIVLRSLSDADSKPIATPIAINATEEERSLPLSGILFIATITAIRVA